MGRIQLARGHSKKNKREEFRPKKNPTLRPHCISTELIENLSAFFLPSQNRQKSKEVRGRQPTETGGAQNKFHLCHCHSTKLAIVQKIQVCIKKGFKSAPSLLRFLAQDEL